MSSVITLGGIPTLAGLTGSAVGSESLLRTINSELNNSDFFGGINDLIKESRNMFVQHCVQPTRTVINTLKNLVGMTEFNDQFIPITSEDRLKAIPVCMHDSIMRFAPIKKLFNEGRIFGFGWEYVPDDDPYERLIKNGRVDDLLEAVDDNGEFTLSYEWHSDDPELTFEEVESIEESRLYLEKFLEESDMDPTDYGNVRG